MRKNKQATDKHNAKFEDYFQELEKTVRDLEEEELDLETSLKKYESGIKALQKCYEILTGMEKRIEILTKDKEGILQARPFKPGKTLSKEDTITEDEA
jgi:exodeoxyribonuclease VII small subunit